MVPVSCFIPGGVGFIGSHFVDRLLADPQVKRVTVFDNMSSGREWHFAHHLGNSRFAFVCGDVGRLDALTAAICGHETVIHLASNPEIAKAQVEPTVDFDQGTLLTQNVVEAMRRSGARTIFYASGSGKGDLGEAEASERDAIGLPISTYGASKLAEESLISAYCYMFDLQGRFASATSSGRGRRTAWAMISSSGGSPIRPGSTFWATASRASPTSMSMTWSRRC
jgi:UDP-glucose 4-epimerase